MGTILAIPILLFTVMVQSVVMPRIPLLYGTADLVMLVVIAWGLQDRPKNSWFWTLLAGLLVSFVSALPAFVPLIALLLINLILQLIRHRIWQMPILMMLFMTFLGTFIHLLLSFAVLRFNGTLLPLSESLSLVVFPSVLLNLILALPVYVVISDLANAVYPAEIEM